MPHNGVAAVVATSEAFATPPGVAEFGVILNLSESLLSGPTQCVTAPAIVN